MSPDHRPVSSDEMIGRAREDLVGASSTSTVTPPVPRKVDVDIAEVDPDPGMVRQGPGDDGIYLDNVTNGGIPQSDGGHLLAARPGDVYLRLRVSGNTFLGSYSVDGSTWRSAGTITKTLLSPRIGIVAAPNDPVSPPAYFDFFETTP